MGFTDNFLESQARAKEAKGEAAPLERFAADYFRKLEAEQLSNEIAKQQQYEAFNRERREAQHNADLEAFDNLFAEIHYFLDDFNSELLTASEYAEKLDLWIGAWRKVIRFETALKSRFSLNAHGKRAVDQIHKLLKNSFKEIFSNSNEILSKFTFDNISKDIDSGRFNIDIINIKTFYIVKNNFLSLVDDYNAANSLEKKTNLWFSANFYLAKLKFHRDSETKTYIKFSSAVDDHVSSFEKILRSIKNSAIENSDFIDSADIENWYNLFEPLYQENLQIIETLHLNKSTVTHSIENDISEAIDAFFVGRVGDLSKNPISITQLTEGRELFLSLSERLEKNIRLIVSKLIDWNLEGTTSNSIKLFDLYEVSLNSSLQHYSALFKGSTQEADGELLKNATLIFDNMFENRKKCLSLVREKKFKKARELSLLNYNEINEAENQKPISLMTISAEFAGAILFAVIGFMLVGDKLLTGIVSLLICCVFLFAFIRGIIALSKYDEYLSTLS